MALAGIVASSGSSHDVPATHGSTTYATLVPPTSTCEWYEQKASATGGAAPPAVIEVRASGAPIAFVTPWREDAVPFAALI